MPAQRWSSAIACASEHAVRYGRSLVIAEYASQTEMMRAGSGIACTYESVGIAASVPVLVR